MQKSILGKIKGSVLLFATTAFVGVACAQQVTLTLQPDATRGKDAMIGGYVGSGGTNYGSTPQFAASAWTAGGSPTIYRSLVAFDISSIPANAIVNSAYISLYAWDSPNTGLGQHDSQNGASNACWLERITSNWDENTVTWDTQPATTPVNHVAMAAATSPTEDYTNIDVTALAQDMVNDPTNSFGFMLKLQDEAYYRKLNFSSSDHTNAALHPKFVITYTVPASADTCIAIQPDATKGKDAIIGGYVGSGGTNYGSNAQFPASAWTAGGSPVTYRSVIAFDLSSIPSHAVVSSAVVSLYAWDRPNTGLGQHDSQNGASNACWFEKITSSWDENTVTWDTQPTTTPVNRATLAASTSPTENYSIDVTAMAQDMVNNPTSNFGFMLKLQDENYYRKLNFASSDHTNGALHPKIEICYSTKTTGIKKLTVADTDVQLFPNPNTGIFDITMGSADKGVIDIYNYSGALVKHIEAVNNSTKVDISEFSKGLYLVKVAVNGKISVSKVLVN